MPVRTLLACTAALALLLALMAAAAWADWPLGGRTTRFGLIPTWELAAVAIAMGLGGAIARTGFRAPAIALVALASIASLVAAWMFSAERTAADASWLLKNNLASLVLTAATAWLAAGAGERLAAALGNRTGGPARAD